MENKIECIIDGDGSKRWYLNNDLHREDGPAIEFSSGTKVWYYYGIRHREDGPAVIYADGEKEWWFNGKWHRLDGPAIIGFSVGKQWWIHDNDVTSEIHQWANENDIDLDNLSENDKLLIKLTWADYEK